MTVTERPTLPFFDRQPEPGTSNKALSALPRYNSERQATFRWPVILTAILKRMSRFSALRPGFGTLWAALRAFRPFSLDRSATNRFKAIMMATEKQISPSIVRQTEFGICLEARPDLRVY